VSEFIERVVSDLRSTGLDLRGIGGEWFALHRSANTSPSAFLHLNKSDVLAYLSAMTAEDVDGAFGPGVDIEKARYSLLLLHLEEALETGSSAFRYVFIERGDIRALGRGDSLPILPPDEYEWRAAPN
jgi:hypothetical protein